MRIKTAEELNKLGPYAKQKIEAALKAQGAFEFPPNNRINGASVPPPSTASHKNSPSRDISASGIKKTRSPARVMRTTDGLSYCPWPSTDPFVTVYQRLESRYGLLANGGLLVTELVVEGGAKDWRFDFALISPLNEMTLSLNGDTAQSTVWVGSSYVLLEADGFGFHRSKDAFKNDRAKQTHALKQGFVVKRITNDDARNRLDEMLGDIDEILSHQRIYKKHHTIERKGLTHSLFRWLPAAE